MFWKLCTSFFEFPFVSNLIFIILEWIPFFPIICFSGIIASDQKCFDSPLLIFHDVGKGFQAHALKLNDHLLKDMEASVNQVVGLNNALGNIDEAHHHALTESSPYSNYD